ncbi:ComEC/Rec2 family competence protein [Sulfitobacter sabulilitoris]|uniref:ComEC/Rec2 family competence protein n=1 Tax=Sulfitobacter sabulilitoris TaxID=2562655 RepID=A0A5S3PKU6_9RHOB|nr:ComEC/Rec2 family competence protein [Sulfitobacter sabulilitoris]TMM54876.1 ComEC/Rec2 family competence protein [Sulfitobacter sabulilitoris]
MRGLARTHAILLAQRGHLIGWVPVCLAIGIGLYFSVRFEPTGVHYIALGAIGVVSLVLWHRGGEAFGPIGLALVLVALGVGLAGIRAHDVAGPVLGWRYYGPIEGRIVAMDRSASDALRLTLDQVVLNRVPPSRTPVRVRVSLHAAATGVGIPSEPGLRVMTTGHLSPPSGPVEPGGFDFQRHAWFARLGAVGYTRVPLLGIAPAAEGHAGLALFRIRMAASARIRAVLPGDIGGVAAAVTTGDRSAISQATLDDLRASNLAHLLAISGLHMGLLSGFVFALLRLVLAAVPYVALRWPTRKIAAGVALLAATGYLALSGGNVATERAYVMVAVALLAIMVNRRAISLRAVAIAATIVLVLRPEALMGPGFQMSFAATTALVAVFGWLRDRDLKLGPRWIQPAVAVVISSAVAGLATAPIGAAHFNAVAQYGLLANLASVPLMGALVVPAAVLALCLAPFGAEAMGLWIMGLGLRWILGVSDWVAGLEGARTHVPGPGAGVLPLLALGFLWLLLWQGRARWGGIAAMALAFALWAKSERPLGLIADNGSLVGVMTPAGRAISKPKGAGFVARNWLENDGDPTPQDAAAARWTGRIGPGQVVHLVGKRGVAAHAGCTAGQIVVASVAFAPADSACRVLDPDALRRTGSVAIYVNDGKLALRTAREVTGNRIWTAWPN